ncbi:LemA protein [hydrothermal vent metagenome]|uniref:LemA protein n=1 Tax=hydrothermal vent metagenome TaxID=652676 RepID=A0A3B1DCX1_9ZZZZ
MVPLFIGLGALGLFVVLVFVVIAMYNSLVRARVECDNGWAQIDVQLKRRYDLIPNLVETVKGYASHEKETLEAVIQARQQAVAITSDSAHAAQKADAENMISQTLGRLFALSEAYPELKADTNFRQLQEELTSTENKIGFARQHFNDTVGSYEERRQTFPNNLIAAMFNFDEREYFELGDAAQREAPKVSFS